MKRDGQCISLWQQGMPWFVSNQNSSNEADVVIIGGGITGLSVGLELQKAGKNCIVVEAQNIGFGTSSGTTAHLNTIMDTPYHEIKSEFGDKASKLIYKLATNSISTIKNNIEEHSIDCGFDMKSAFLFSQNEDESKDLEKIFNGARKVGASIGYNGELPISIPFENVVEVKDQAQMHATQYLYGLADAFQKAGGKLVQYCKVTNVVSENNETYVITAGEKIKTSHVVYATHIPPGVNILHFLCTPYRSYAMAVKLKDNNYPDALVYDMEEPYHYYRTQEIDGEKYLIAGGEDHKTGQEINTEYCFTKLESYIRKYFNVESIDFKWSSQYFESGDGLPYIGHLPGNPKNVYVATGFGGNGIIYGTAAGVILKDLILTGKSEYKDLLNPNRIKPVIGFVNIIKKSADAAGNFVGKRFSMEKVHELVELSKGEAKIVNYEDLSVAMYKDDAGKVFAVNPACSHIKCIVAWNSAEKSWDCPCHGSRFSYTGELLTGPAKKDLEVIDLTEKEEKEKSEKIHFENLG